MQANFGRRAWLALIVWLLVGLAILVPVVLIGQASGRSFRFLFSDMAEQARVNSLTGIMSSLTGLAWVVAATVFGFTAALAGPKDERGPGRGFFIGFALLSIWLALDDVFLIHDYLAFRYFGYGEALALLPLLVFALVLAGLFWRDLFGAGLPVVAGAVGLLGASLMFDALPMLHDAQNNDVQNLYEDGLKWLGAVVWAGYAVTVSARKLRQRLAAN